MTGADYFAINPKGNVPCLILDDGTLLNEGAAVLQFIADQAPGKVAPENGSNGRYLVQNMLNYVSSEIHASIGPLFIPSLTPEVKAHRTAIYMKKLKFVNDVLLNGHDYLVGSNFTIVDGYLYITLTWVGYVGVDISCFTNVVAYVERIKALPAVVASHSLMATNPAKTC